MSHTLRIGSRIGSADPFWVQVREAVERHSQQLAVTLVPVDIGHSSTLGSKEELALVDELLAQDLDALICTFLPDGLAYRILDFGLPIILLTESDVRHPQFASPLGFYHISQMIGSYLIERLAGGGRVLVVGGMLAERGEDGRSRLAGIRAVLREHPAMQLEHIPSSWRYEQAYGQIHAAMQSIQTPPDAIFGLSDSLALAGRDAGRACGLVDTRTLVVGINGDPSALAAIAEGSMTATVETSAADFGAQAVDLACRAAQGKPLPKHLSYKPRLVTAEHVAEVAVQKLIAIADLPNRLVGVNREQEGQRLVQLETSLEISRRVGSILDRRQLSREIADLIRESYGYDHVKLFLYLEHEQALLQQQDGGQVRVSLADAWPLREALARNELLFIPNTQHSHRFPVDPAHPDTRSRIIVPIRYGGRALGLLDLHSTQLLQRSSYELAGLQSLADQLGVAMRNAELYSDALDARAVAEKADQLKSRLLANVSHELRTPLNLILGYSGTVLDSPDAYGQALPPALLHDLHRINRSGKHLIRLINDLLDLSRAEIDELPLFPEAIAPRPFLEEVFHSMADHARQSAVAWSVQLPPRLPMIEADPVRLRQILLNLLANARKFTERGQIVLGAEVALPHLHIWVQDTGCGIPIDLQERIFEPFVTGEHAGRRNEGIGLGLCITHRLLALHHGSMTLESQPGQGSTFHIYLPLPSLSGRFEHPPSSARPVLLLLSARGQSTALADLCQRQGLTLCLLHPEDNVNELLATVRPTALAWDVAHATPEDWSVIQHLRSHSHWCQLPFILYGQDGQNEQDGQDGQQLSVGLTSVLLKPLQGQTVIDTIAALCAPKATGSIMIVDDDPQARELYSRLVATALPSYPVVMAEGGAAALALLARQTPSLMILDLMMPQVDGFAVLAHLRALPQTRQVPVLVISGHILSLKDIERLNHGQVFLHNKAILSESETITAMRRTLDDGKVLHRQTSLLVKRAVAYMQQHHARALSRQEIAEVIGVSKNYLSQIFQHELGISPWEYLNRYRVSQAKALLTNTNESVTTVAAMVGFDDPAYFSRVFRKHAGASPREYRDGQ